MPRIILVNKPYGVLCQFSAVPGRPTLKDYVLVPNVYPAGRLDADSEGLVVLTDDGSLQHRISDPRHKLRKTYWVQVEGQPDQDALSRLNKGIDLGDFTTRPAQARIADEPSWLWPRQPPIRIRRHIPTTWLEMSVSEGKNRQIRRMTAAVGYPTLRLIRYRVDTWSIDQLAVGSWREATMP